MSRRIQVTVKISPTENPQLVDKQATTGFYLGEVRSLEYFEEMVLREIRKLENTLSRYSEIYRLSKIRTNSFNCPLCGIKNSACRYPLVTMDKASTIFKQEIKYSHDIPPVCHSCFWEIHRDNPDKELFDQDRRPDDI